MQKMKFIFLMVLLNTSGCSLLNDVLIDKHKIFENSRNKDVGKKITDVSPNFGHIPSLEKIIKIENNKSEYRHLGFLDGHCEYAYIVEDASKKIIDWRYISKKSYCEEAFFYEGPF